MNDFNKTVSEVFENYHQRMQEEAAIMKGLPLKEGLARRDEFLLPVGKEVGQFLNAMVKAAKSQTVLEIGTSYGYSTLWLAEAVSHHNGKVITLEKSEEKADYAKAMIAKAGLSNYVEFKVGDALKSIAETKETFDFILLDIWKELYVSCFELFVPKLTKDAYVIADNMIFPPNNKPEAMAYSTAVASTKRFDSVLLPLGSGLEVSRLK